MNRPIARDDYPLSSETQYYKVKAIVVVCYAMNRFEILKFVSIAFCF